MSVDRSAANASCGDLLEVAYVPLVRRYAEIHVFPLDRIDIVRSRHCVWHYRDSSALCRVPGFRLSGRFIRRSGARQLKLPGV